MMTLGGNRRLPGLGRAGLAPGLGGIPLNGIPSIPGIGPLGGRGFVGGQFRGLGGGMGGARLNGNALGPGVPGLGIGGITTLGPLGVGGLGSLGGINSLGALTAVNPLLPSGGLYSNQLGSTIPLSTLQKQLTPQQVLALQSAAATGVVGYNHLLDLSRHKDDSNQTQVRRTHDCKTKDITVRGKAYSVRAAYLLDVPKFEADLTKFMDKKKDDDVPDRVVQMLVSFINNETYGSTSVFDEVTLNILASNVGAKSAVDHSLKHLKSIDPHADLSGLDELVKIVYTIMASSRVDDGLVEWLKKMLRKDGLEVFGILMACSAEYQKMADQLPEIHDKILKLVGLKSPENDDFGRTV